MRTLRTVQLVIFCFLASCSVAPFQLAGMQNGGAMTALDVRSFPVVVQVSATNSARYVVARDESRQDDIYVSDAAELRSIFIEAIETVSRCDVLSETIFYPSDPYTSLVADVSC